MASKQTGGDTVTSNGTNTAVFITSFTSNKSTIAAIKQLADICFKPNIPLTLFVAGNIKDNTVDELVKDGKIIAFNGDFDENIKNVCPIAFPLACDVNAASKWITNSNKFFNGKNILVSNGKAHSNAGYLEKYLLYWSNFWQKLFTGADANMVGSELCILSKDDFKNIVLDKKINETWQIAALADKHDKCTKVGFDLPVKSVGFGSSFKHLLLGKLGGFKALFNAFIKAPKLTNEEDSWTNINSNKYKRVFGFSSLVLFVLMLFISYDYNITWDEPNHNNYTQDVVDYYSSFGKDTSVFDETSEIHKDNHSNKFYGMGIDVISSAINRILGVNETVDTSNILSITFTGAFSQTSSDTMYNNQYKRYVVDKNGNITLKNIGLVYVKDKTIAEVKQSINDKLLEANIEATPSVGFYSFKPHHAEFITRHTLNTITGFLAILFAALAVRLLTGWLPAIVTLIALTCSPSFFGHSFNNPKDIPFAAGYIISLYYILKLLKELPNAKHQTKVMLALAIGFSISIRVQGILPLIFMGMFMFIHWAMNNMGKKDNQFLKYLKIGLTVGIVGYVLGILLWPFALRSPISNTLRALTEFDQFQFLTYYELFDGARMFDKPWYYEPKLIALTAPIAILIGLAPALLLGWKSEKTQRMMFIVLVFATFFPTAYIIYKKSYVYNGWRHFIFIYPSLAVIAMYGWYKLISLFKNTKVVTISFVVIALSFAKPAIWSIVNHPYEYMYFNELAGGVKGASGLYELDYWNQTPRAAFKWLIENHPEVKNGNIKISSNNIQEALKTYNVDGKNAKYAWTREYEWADNDWTYAIWTTRTLSRSQIVGGYWPPKGTIHEIKVDGVTVAAVVKSNNNYSYLGKKFLKSNMADSALYYYSKAFEYNPLEEEYARGIADACKLGNKYDSAVMFYNKAIALRDGNYEALQSLGELQFYKAYQNQEAPDKKLADLAFSNLALAYKFKKNSSAPLYMGEIRFQQNQFEEAKGYYNLFLQKYGNVSQGYLGLAKTQLALQESDSALYNLQAAIQLNPRDGQAYQILYTELQRLGRKEEAEQILKMFNEQAGMPGQ